MRQVILKAFVGISAMPAFFRIFEAGSEQFPHFTGAYDFFLNYDDKKDNTPSVWQTLVYLLEKAGKHTEK